MPNHITTIIHAAPYVLQSLLRDVREEDEISDGTTTVVDFNVLIPIPDYDDPIYTSKHTDYGNGMHGWSVDGYSPMDAARDAWGTKWNAYDQTVGAEHIQFNTAWSHPAPVIETLSILHPNEDIHVQYADEDAGYNLGDYVIRNGEVTTDNTPDEGSAAAYELAARVLGGTYEMHENEGSA